MNHSAQEILEITQIIKEKIEKKYSINLEPPLQPPPSRQDEKLSTVPAHFELFGEDDYIFYHISDKTGELIRTLDGYGYDSYLPEKYTEEEKENLKEWDEYEKEHPEDFI